LSSGAEQLIDLLLIAGGAFQIFWGIIHLIPTKSVVEGFGQISKNNKRTLIMEWMNEGFTLIFIGILVILNAVLGVHQGFVNWIAVAMLVSRALLTIATGAKTQQIVFKMCPVISIGATLLIVIGTVM
jgi:hypothetical protein